MCQTYPPSAARIRQAQEIYQELQEMDNQLKIWEMVVEYLASGDFILVILSIFVGVALVKGVNVFDKWLNGSENK
jgi:hypothetical protein